MPAPARHLGPDPHPTGAPADPAGPARVLLLASDPAVIRAVRAGLDAAGAAGIQLHQADGLERGLDRLLGGDVDVVLLDLDLPNGQGPLTLLHLHTYTPRLPVVVLCRPEDGDTARWALEAGARAYVTKGQADGAALGWVLRYAMDHAAWLARRRRRRWPAVTRCWPPCPTTCATRSP